LIGSMGAVPRLIAFLGALALSLAGSAASAQPQFPDRGTSPVVDEANIIDPAAEAELTAKLDAFEEANQRQFVVATVPDLQGYEISDYGYQLGRHWGLGDEENNDGIILLVAPNERKVRIEVGYGLEAIMPDGLAFDVVEQDILPRFREGDMTGGIVAGADRIIQHLELPPEEAQAIAAQATESRAQGGGGFPVGAFIWMGMLFFFFVLPMLGRVSGRRYRRGGAAGAVGNVILWTALNAAMSGGRGGGGFGGGGFGGGGGGGFGGGGFGGGGGSFGGGGASGSW
jgi:uncharacterized protein